MADTLPAWVQRLRDKVEALTGERGANPATRKKEHDALREQVAALAKRIETLEAKT